MSRGSTSPGTIKSGSGGKVPELEWNRQQCQRESEQMWWDLWRSRDFSDVTLYAANGAVIKLHKIALIARSPVMKAAWSQPEVELVDGAPDEVAQFVRQFHRNALTAFFFAMYTGTCLNSDFSFFCTEVYRLAQHFQVEDLVDMTLYIMKRKKNPESALKIYLLARDTKDEELRFDAEQYIVNRRGIVMTTATWKELKADQSPAYLELLEAMASAPPAR